MRHKFFGLCLGLILFWSYPGPLIASTCHQCGRFLPADALYCRRCGARQVTLDDDPRVSPDLSFSGSATINLTEDPPGVFRTKKRLYLYNKRADTRRFLAKNLLWKPDRYLLPGDRAFRLKNRLGSFFELETLPGQGEKPRRGWVHIKEMQRRTNWEETTQGLPPPE